VKKEVAVKSCCSKKHETAPQPRCCKTIGSRSISFSKCCTCFHAEKSSENYIIEGQYKIAPPAIDICRLTSSESPERYMTYNARLQQEIKTNSPPVYISASSLII
jgi:hypothetical protein